MKTEISQNDVNIYDDEHHPSLQKLFVYASVLSIIVIPIIVGLGVSSIYRRHIINHAIKDSRKIGNTLLEKYFQLLLFSDTFTKILTLSEHDIINLNNNIKKEIENYHLVNTIVKIKLYSKNKKIIYSNDNKIIGKIDNYNRKLEKALKGKFTWAVTKKGEILDFNDELIFNINVVATYIPIIDINRNIKCVIELYFDISGDKKEITRVVTYSSLSTFIFLIFLFGGMFIFINHANTAKTKANQAAQLANQQRLLDEEIRQHSTITAVGELASSIAHQVNNPITVALTRIGYIYKKTNSFKNLGKLQDDFITIKNQIESVAKIMKIMLHGSKHWTYVPKNINIANIISRIIPLLELKAKNNNIKIETSVEPPNLSFVADPILLEQIIINISNNAVDAIIDKNTSGTVSVKSYPFNNDYICIEIKDDGIGIEKENLNKIFNSFYSTKKGDRGTGLGLVIAHRLVERHEGRIEVDSTPQLGTTFRILLPKNSEITENY